MKKNTKKGFTLVELLVVIAILAILSSVAVVGYTAFIDKANDAKADAEVRNVQNILDAALIDPSVKAVKLASNIYVIKDTSGNIVSATCPASITGDALEDVSSEVVKITLTASAGKVLYGTTEVFVGISCPNESSHTTTACTTCGGTK